MSLGALLLGIWLVLLGITWMGWVAITTLFLGIWAFVTGVVWLIEGFQPIVIWKRP